MKYKVIPIGIGLAALFWILESAIHVFVFHEGTIIEHIFFPTFHEIWMRSFAGGTIILLIISVDMYMELKKVEKKLKQVMDDLERSNRDLEQFAYVASHDLQEPLRMVSSYMQLIEQRYKSKLDADAEEFIMYAVDGADRMQMMINDLLEYSQVDTRGKPFEPVNSAAVLDQVLANLEVFIEESGAIVTHDALPTVMADSSQLVRMFQNLIDNAIKFHSDKPPEVHVGVDERKDEWIFYVRDNGIGIAPEYHERIFQVFQRLHGKGEYPGTGIGLAICKRVAECHGGRIWLESEPEKGSTFYFTVNVRGGEKP